MVLSRKAYIVEGCGPVSMGCSMGGGPADDGENEVLSWAPLAKHDQSALSHLRISALQTPGQIPDERARECRTCGFIWALLALVDTHTALGAALKGFFILQLCIFYLYMCLLQLQIILVQYPIQFLNLSPYEGKVMCQLARHKRCVIR
jgi:hypothetical protein